MKRGAIRQISWAPLAFPEEAAVKTADREPMMFQEVMLELPVTLVAAALPSPLITPPPANAVEEAKILLRIAAEVEGALMVQYLYAAYSILPAVIVTTPPIPTAVNSDDWYDLIRDIAKQEMGHLVTVQNLLLSLGEVPHLDRENFPWLKFDLYPFPFHLQVLGLETLAKNVAAGFFPGIESSITLRDKDIYVEPFRLNQANVAKVFPGCLTEIMAVPWQADFNDCEGAIWWPSQRPDIAMLDRNGIPASQADWANPISDHQGMVDNVQRLGFIPIHCAGSSRSQYGLRGS